MIEDVRRRPRPLAKPRLPPAWGASAATTAKMAGVLNSLRPSELQHAPLQARSRSRAACRPRGRYSIQRLRPRRGAPPKEGDDLSALSGGEALAGTPPPPQTSRPGRPSGGRTPSALRKSRTPPPIGLRARQVAPENATSVTNLSQRAPPDVIAHRCIQSDRPSARRDKRRDDRIAGEPVDGLSGAEPPGAVDDARLADAGAEDRCIRRRCGRSLTWRAIISLASIPFSSVTTRVSWPISGASAPSRGVGRPRASRRRERRRRDRSPPVVGGVDAGEGHVAGGHLQPQAVPPQGLEMGAPGDEVDPFAPASASRAPTYPPIPPAPIYRNAHAPPLAWPPPTIADRRRPKPGEWRRPPFRRDGTACPPGSRWRGRAARRASPAREDAARPWRRAR